MYSTSSSSTSFIIIIIVFSSSSSSSSTTYPSFWSQSPPPLPSFLCILVLLIFPSVPCSYSYTSEFVPHHFVPLRGYRSRISPPIFSPNRSSESLCTQPSQLVPCFPVPRQYPSFLVPHPLPPHPQTIPIPCTLLTSPSSLFNPFFLSFLPSIHLFIHPILSCVHSSICMSIHVPPLPPFSLILFRVPIHSDIHFSCSSHHPPPTHNPSDHSLMSVPLLPPFPLSTFFAPLSLESPPSRKVFVGSYFW